MNYSLDLNKSNMMKGIGMLLLLFHHLFYYTGDYINKLSELNVDSFPFTLYQLGQIAEIGKVCVAIFVFVSAFGITKKSMHYALNINLKKSIVRYIKLYSNYFFIYFLVIVIGLFSNYNNFEVYNNNLLFFLNDLLGLSYIYGTPLYNYTWWYIGMAFFIIFIVPFILEICKRNGGGWINYCFCINPSISL